MKNLTCALYFIIHSSLRTLQNTNILSTVKYVFIGKNMKIIVAKGQSPKMRTI